MNRKHETPPASTVGKVRRPRISRVAKRTVRFKDLVAPALEAKKLRGNQSSSLVTDHFRLRRILPVLGNVKMRQLSAARIERFLLDLARGDSAHAPLSGATVNRFRSLISSIFRYALRQGFVGANPLGAGALPWSKESAIVPRFLHQNEQRKLLYIIHADYGPIKALEWELSVLTGMRRSEQYNSRWQDWHVQQGVLEVVGKGGQREAVRISSAAARCLRRLRKRAPAGQIFITPERNEGPCDRRLWFERCVRKAALQERYRWHDNRHTFCSRLVQAGEPLLTVQQLARHKSFQTTLRYSHLAPDNLARAVEKVEF
jgi:site-specific recombinase XerD